MLERLARMYDNPEVRAKLLVWFWLISLGVLLLGFGIIAWRAFGGR